MRYWQGLLSFSQLSRLIRLGGRPQANWICLGLINSGRPIARKTYALWLFLFVSLQVTRKIKGKKERSYPPRPPIFLLLLLVLFFFEAEGIFLNSQMKRPTKSNCETVVVGCSDFNQTPFNLPDLSKSAHIKTAQL